MGASNRAFPSNGPCYRSPQNLGTTSGHLESENFVDCPYKRHHQSTLVFSPPCFASRGSPVRSRSRPPTIFVSMKYRRSVPRIPPAAQAGGRGFESRHVHKLNPALSTETEETADLIPTDYWTTINSISSSRFCPFMRGLVRARRRHGRIRTVPLWIRGKSKLPTTNCSAPCNLRSSLRRVESAPRTQSSGRRFS